MTTSPADVMRLHQVRARAGSWRVMAADRLRWLECESAQLEGHGVPCVEKALGEARAALAVRRPFSQVGQRIAAWWSGWDIERTWRALHDAEARTMAQRRDLSGLMPTLRSWIRNYLPAEDPRVKALHFDAKNATPAHRLALEQAIRAAFAVSDNNYDVLRGHRNKLFVATLALAVLTLILGVRTAQFPDMLPLCVDTNPADQSDVVVCPTGNQQGRSGGDIWFVFLLGAIGAAIAAVQSLLTLRQSAAPYTLSGYLALVKILLGAVFAAVGLLFLTAGVLGSALTMGNRGALLAAAVVLGYSQQIGTRVLDSYAKQIMTETRPGAGGP